MSLKFYWKMRKIDKVIRFKIGWHAIFEMDLQNFQTRVLLKTLFKVSDGYLQNWANNFNFF